MPWISHPLEVVTLPNMRFYFVFTFGHGVDFFFFFASLKARTGVEEAQGLGFELIPSRGCFSRVQFRECKKSTITNLQTP